MTKPIVLAISPAKRESRRIAFKMTRPLACKTIMQYTIEAALDAEAIDRIVLATNSKTFNEMARHYGITTPLITTPDEMADREQGAYDGIINTLQLLEEEEGYIPDELVLLMPTCPLRTAEDINMAFGLYRMLKPPALLSVSPCKPIRYYCYLKDGKIYEHEESPLNPKILHRFNGAVYITSYNNFMLHKTFHIDGAAPFIMPPERGIDIDTELDLQIAEYLITKR